MIFSLLRHCSSSVSLVQTAESLREMIDVVLSRMSTPVACGSSLLTLCSPEERETRNSSSSRCQCSSDALHRSADSSMVGERQASSQMSNTRHSFEPIPTTRRFLRSNTFTGIRVRWTKNDNVLEDTNYVASKLQEKETAIVPSACFPT